MCGEYQDDATIPPPEIFLSSIPRGLPRQETSGQRHRRTESVDYHKLAMGQHPFPVTLRKRHYFEKTNKFDGSTRSSIYVF